MRIAPAKRALIAKFPREIPSLARYSPLRTRDTRELSRPLSYRRVAAEIPESQGVADPLQRISCSSRRYIATGESRRATGERKGGHHLGRQISKHTTESDRGNESESRAEKRERRSTLERKGCVVGGNLKEVGTRERKREADEGGESGRVGEFGLRRGGAQPGLAQVSGSRGLWHRLSSSSASSINSWEIRSPRDALPVADVDFGTRRFSAMDPPVDFSPLFFVFLFGYTICAFLSERETKRFRERFARLVAMVRLRIVGWSMYGIKFVCRDDSRDSIDRTLGSVVHIDLLMRSSMMIIW